MIKITNTVLVFSFLFLVSCQTTKAPLESDVQTTMVQFDQAYIPALALTNKGKMKPAQKAMDILSSEWPLVRQEMEGFYPHDKSVKKHLDDIDEILMTANTSLSDGVALGEIHDILEEVKSPFQEIRRETQIFYPLDTLDEYHTTMEEIILFLEEKVSSEFSAEDYVFLKEKAAQSVMQWGKIEELEIDPVLFGFSEAEMDKLYGNIAAGKEFSAHFDELVAQENSEGILLESKKLKPFYTKVFLMFGNFNRLK